MVKMVLCLVLIYLRLCVSWLYTSFKWEHCLAPLSHSNDVFVLFCVEMSVYFQHFSVHVKADRNKPRRQRLCRSGWIILKWSWCLYSSFQNLQNKPFFSFPASKQWKEIYFQPFAAWHSALGVGFPDLTSLFQLIHAWRLNTNTAFSCLPDSRTGFLLLFLLHLIHRTEYMPCLVINYRWNYANSSD